MPPKNSSENVSRLPPDEQISHLTHQYENLEDRLYKVEEGQAELGKQFAELRGDVNKLTNSVTIIGQTSTENNLLLREVMLFLKGQATPGLERPGLTDDFKAHHEKIIKLELKLETETKTIREEHENKCKALDARIKTQEDFKARVGWAIMGFTAASTGFAWKYWPMIEKLIASLQ